ncbi:MAG TPA: bifunctional pyr operon transcriptional regulator/uracil phosphoribosyltransferase PyrR [Candidatus Dormibacteraeota bacterium]|nr:bifunctional pyr operon transcriptional regulator/uracil phosphoribosyltransferase PyrR [Candidatus Dormibacteraeota bacterium]
MRASLPPVPQDGKANMVLDGESMRRSWRRVAHEVIERNGKDCSVLFAGVPTRGVPLARRLAELVLALGADADVIELDVEAHRDDRPADDTFNPTGEPGSEVEGRVVVVVDDVLFHGRTVRAALDALTELGRPAEVQLAVMVDRGHRELPIRADYVGKNIPTRLSDRVRVCLEEVDGQDGVVVLEGTGG